MRMTYGEPSEAENQASYTKQLSYKYKGQMREIKKAIQTITLHEVKQIQWRYGESSIAEDSRSNQHHPETKPNEALFYEESDGEKKFQNKGRKQKLAYGVEGISHLCNIHMQDEGADILQEKLQLVNSEMQITDEASFTKQQIFNVEKATLYWTKMSFKHEGQLKRWVEVWLQGITGHVACLLGADALGDLKLSPS